MDSCMRKRLGCDAHATCANTGVGTHTCTCAGGFFGPTGATTCAAHADCDKGKEVVSKPGTATDDTVCAAKPKDVVVPVTVVKTTTKDKADDELNSFQADMKADAEAIGEERGKSSALPTVIDPKFEPLSKKIPGADLTLVGGTKDVHGCLAAAGMSWCAALSKCIRPFETKCVPPPPAAVAPAPAGPAAVSAAASGGCVNAVGDPVPASLCKAPPAPARAWVTKGTLTFTGLPQDTEITAAMESTLKTVLSKKCGATPTQIEIVQEDKIVEAPPPSSSGGSGGGSSSTEGSLLDALSKDPTAVKTDASESPPESPPEVTTDAAVALLEEAVVGGQGGQGEQGGLVVAYVIQSSSEAKAASERSAMETLKKGGAATLGPLLEEIKKGSSVTSSFAKASSVAVSVDKDSGSSSGSSGSGSSAAGSGASAIGSGSSAVSGSSGSSSSSSSGGSGSGSGGVTSTSGAASTPKAVFVPKEAGDPIPKATDYSSSILSVSPEEVRLQLYVRVCVCVRVCVYACALCCSWCMSKLQRIVSVVRRVRHRGF